MDNQNNKNKGPNNNRQGWGIILFTTLLITFIVMGLFSLMRGGTPEEISYDKFLKLVDNKKVESVTFTNSRINIVLTDSARKEKLKGTLKEVKDEIHIPMVFMTYANVVYSYGTERFIAKAADIGMNGLILPDVPFEEKKEFDSVCKTYGLDLISLIAPTSHERITRIAKEAEGFVYCVSSLGVTGMRSAITTDIGAMVRLVKAAKDIPCAVGFGISTPQQAGEMAAKSDGAIVGSAIVKLCEKYGTDCVPHVKEYVAAMKEGVLRG